MPAGVCWVVMGVCGSGKSTVGSMLAEALGGRFIEADAFHPPANIEKMKGGNPLTDEDRWPWLLALGAEAAGAMAGGEGVVVIACSALRRCYRDLLMGKVTGEGSGSGGDGRLCVFLHLRVAKEVAEVRVEVRGARGAGHFMPSSLVASQFDALEVGAEDAGHMAEADMVAMDPAQVVQRVTALHRGLLADAGVGMAEAAGRHGLALGREGGEQC